jgi:hypothetical protein
MSKELKRDARTQRSKPAPSAGDQARIRSASIKKSVCCGSSLTQASDELCHSLCFPQIISASRKVGGLAVPTPPTTPLSFSPTSQNMTIVCALSLTTNVIGDASPVRMAQRYSLQRRHQW